MPVLKSLFACCVLVSVPFGAVSAQDINFKFNNPSFGGNSFNSGHLLGLAEIQQQHSDPVRARVAVEPPTATERLIESLERRIISDTSQRLLESLTDVEPGQSVTSTLGDTTITSVADAAGNITTTITNNLTGEFTTIGFETAAALMSAQ